MDMTVLVPKIAGLLAKAMPALMKGVDLLPESVVDKIGKERIEQARAIWELLKGPIEGRPAAKEATEDLAENPEDADTEPSFAGS